VRRQDSSRKIKQSVRMAATYCEDQPMATVLTTLQV
jgi:hypothetical protein